MLLLSFILFALQTSGRFSIEYDRIDSTLASEIVMTAENALPEISDLVGYSYDREIYIKLVSSPKEFQALTQSGFPDWGVGFADWRNSFIIIYSPRIIRRNVDIQSITRHEIAHLVIGNLFGSGRLPRWFNEGFAMYCSQEWRFGRERILAFANLSNSLIPLSELEISFPREAGKAELAYTESFSAITYIIDNFGEEGFREILLSLEGKNFEEALFLTLGITYKEFGQEWEDWAKRTYNWFYYLFTGSIILLIMLAVFFIVGIKSLITRQKKLKELEGEMPLQEES